MIKDPPTSGGQRLADFLENTHSLLKDLTSRLELYPRELRPKIRDAWLEFDASFNLQAMKERVREIPSGA